MAGAPLSVRKTEVIRVVQEYSTLIPDQGYIILLRERQPGSLVRDGEYGYRAS